MLENVKIDSEITMSHVGRIYKLVNEIPFFEGKKINVIEILPGGLTNSNYKVTIDNVTYALRLAGDGTMEYLDRPAEKLNAGMMADIGINAAIVFYDETTGNQVCKYVDDSKTLHIPDFRDGVDYLKKAAKLFRKYHDSGKEFKAEFNPLKETLVYKDLIAQKDYDFYEGAELMEQKLDEIKAVFDKNPQKLVPSHNDPLCENWLDDKKDFYLIDWEYGGMNQPMFDLGALVLEAELNDDKVRLLLTEYYGREVTDQEYGLLIINMFLCDALWSYWAVLQAANGKSREEYWPYGLNRFNRAYELIHNGSLDKSLAAFN